MVTDSHTDERKSLLHILACRQCCQLRTDQQIIRAHCNGLVLHSIIAPKKSCTYAYWAVTIERKRIYVLHISLLLLSNKVKLCSVKFYSFCMPAWCGQEYLYLHHPFSSSGLNFMCTELHNECNRPHQILIWNRKTGKTPLTPKPSFTRSWTTPSDVSTPLTRHDLNQFHPSFRHL